MPTNTKKSWTFTRQHVALDHSCMYECRWFKKKKKKRFQQRNCAEITFRYQHPNVPTHWNPQRRRSPPTSSHSCLLQGNILLKYLQQQNTKPSRLWGKPTRLSQPSAEKEAWMNVAGLMKKKEIYLHGKMNMMTISRQVYWLRVFSNNRGFIVSIDRNAWIKVCLL